MASRCHSCHCDFDSDNDSVLDVWDIDGLFSDTLRRQIRHVSTSTHYLQSPTLCRGHSSRESSACNRARSTCPSRSTARDANSRPSSARSRSPSMSFTVDASWVNSTTNKEAKAKRRKSTQRPTEPRDVAVKMDSPIVRAVMEMDIPEARIRETILARLAEKGEDFPSSEALVEAIFSSDLNHHGEIVSSDPKPHEATDSLKLLDENSLKLMEENRVLKEQRQCKICMDEDVCVVFMPCGHLVCCDTCAPTIKVCPICRAKIKKTVRAYLS